MQVIDSRFQKLSQQIEGTIQQMFRECLLNQFNKYFDKIKNELHCDTEKVEKLETVASNIESIQDEIKNLKIKIKQCRWQAKNK